METRALTHTRMGAHVCVCVLCLLDRVKSKTKQIAITATTTATTPNDFIAIAAGAHKSRQHFFAQHPPSQRVDLFQLQAAFAQNI